MIEFIEWLKASDENFLAACAVLIGLTWALCAVGHAWTGKDR